MKARIQVQLTALAVSTMFAARAEAVYTLLSVTRLDTTANTYSGPLAVSVYRVYATFSSPEDQLYSWGAGTGPTGQGPGTIRSRNHAHTALGSNFRNFGGNGDLPPSQYAVDYYPATAFDSFLTINANRSDQFNASDGGPPYLTYAPSFGTQPDSGVNSFTFLGLISLPWAIGPTPTPLTFAGYSGDGDPLFRVLLMQLTVLAGDGVDGTIGLTLRDNSHQHSVYSVTDQTFTSFQAPGPGAWLTLGFAVCHGRSRRREDR